MQCKMKTKVSGVRTSRFNVNATFSAKCFSTLSDNDLHTGAGAAELTRMFPTPPSLEHNAAPSPSGPVGVPDLLMGDGSDPFFTKGMDAYCNYGSPGFEAVRVRTLRALRFLTSKEARLSFVALSKWLPETFGAG